MKKLLAFIFALLIPVGAALAAPAVDGGAHGGLKDGTYDIEVESSSSMFRIVSCELTVSGGEMTALMTLSGTGYEKLFMGTGEEALAAPDSEFIYYQEDAEGRYAYLVPVNALDADIPCAAFSIRKQTWYDRTLVFKSKSLPESAFKPEEKSKPSVKSTVTGVLIGAALAVAAAALVCIAEKKKKKNEGN